MRICATRECLPEPIPTYHEGNGFLSISFLRLYLLEFFRRGKEDEATKITVVYYYHY